MNDIRNKLILPLYNIVMLNFNLHELISICHCLTIIFMKLFLHYMFKNLRKTIYTNKPKKVKEIGKSMPNEF